MGASQQPRTVKCPHCPKTKDSGSKREPEFHIAMHMANDPEHPEDSYPEARKTLENEGSGGSGEDAPGDDGGTPGGSEGDLPSDVTATDKPKSGAIHLEETNPLYDTPKAIADGGAEECPDCDEEMDTVKSGTKIKGYLRGEGTKVSAVSDGDDYVCPDCDLVVDSAGNVVQG